VTRVAVVGNGGSGKTWLALRLADALHIPVIHLDLYRYDASGIIRSDKVFRREVRERLTGTPDWVADGNYLGTMDDRLALADLVVLLDLPVVVCLAGVLGRQVRHRGRRVEDASHTDRFDRGFVYYVATFRHQMRPRVLARLVASGRPVIRARTRRQVRTLADRAAHLGPAADLITALRPSEGFR
jgi:adenylate kinase family enzyme